jgi:microcystin degradation protein MlrC
MGTKVLVYADGDQAKADSLARQLADELIGLRDKLAVDYPDIDTALDRALALNRRPWCWPIVPTTRAAGHRAIRPSF